MANRVYHWKHGWIPLDHVAALSKAKGNHAAASKMLDAVKHEHLPREKHITAAHTNGRVALHDSKTGHSAGVDANVAASLHEKGHHVESVNRDGTLTTRASNGSKHVVSPSGDIAAQQESHRLAAQADAKRAEANRVAGNVGVGDTAAGRLSGAGLKQFHRNTDSSLRRYTALMAEADALDHKAILAREREAKKAHVDLTPDQLKGAKYVRDRYGWHEVVRVNGKSVTVKTGYSWNDSIAIGKILQAKH